MPMVFASPGLKWEGFGPHAYELDGEKARDLPLMNQQTGENTTVGDILTLFRDQKVVVDHPVVTIKLTSESQEIVLRGPQVHLEILAFYFWVAEQGVSPFEVRWYYYDKDHCLEDMQQQYRFFLVANDKIIKEHMSLPDWLRSGFDPAILIARDDDPTWAAEESWSAAIDSFWYRKFYSETRTGQLMALRPDKPPLYHCEEPNPSVATERWLAEIQKVFVSTRLAAWLVVALLLLNLYLRFT